MYLTSTVSILEAVSVCFVFNKVNVQLFNMLEDSSDIIIETIEIFINVILCIREVYPQQIFAKKKIFNSPVNISIYPPLNQYLLNVLTAAKELKEKRELRKVELCIYKDEFTVYENYVFEIDDKNLTLSADNKDKYLIQFEEKLRKSLLLISGLLKDLGKLPDDAKFKINLHTTQIAYVKMCSKPEHQEFPWLQETENNLPHKSQISILPLTTIEDVGIQLYTEKY